eukprot:gnl/MRDRNA2_/MRDRNA2_106756_c0_seq1.p1 gnl/MRDRNA2_/MRDRNA2_106756_c0~~gnl/MRDRNA2_/MRDRNA2_106756_c0_seq1.p1  ORF type:complete len:324 (-),score=80.26 gnl/MRDRNA2_/MRDRNA2_106756_c0_seq1:26-997(-)
MDSQSSTSASCSSASSSSQTQQNPGSTQTSSETQQDTQVEESNEDRAAVMAESAGMLSDTLQDTQADGVDTEEPKQEEVGSLVSSNDSLEEVSDKSRTQEQTAEAKHEEAGGDQHEILVESGHSEEGEGEREKEEETVDRKGMAAKAKAKSKSISVAEPAAKRQRVGRALRPEGWKVVPGFECVGVQVAASCGKKLPKTQSWCFVPLIYSALGHVPERLAVEGTSTDEQISEAQRHWERLFSHWPQWRKELAEIIVARGTELFVSQYLPKNPGGWKTSMVFGEPKVYGTLPHPSGSHQDKTLALLHPDTQGQIFASVFAIASA